MHLRWYCYSDEAMLNLDMPGRRRKKECFIRLELLVLQLALQLLRFCHLAHCLVEVVLIDGITVISNREQTTGK